MGGLDGWWVGLRPGDRRLVVLFLGIIVLTLPFYALAFRLNLGPGTLFAAALGRGTAPPTPGTPLSPGEVVAQGTASTVLVLVRDARGQLSNGTGVAVQRDRVITNAHVVEGAVEILSPPATNGCGRGRFLASTRAATWRSCRCPTAT